MVKISGHRGYKGKEIENSKSALLRAIDEKLDYVEIDIRVSADNVPVLFHDKRINRLLNGSGKVHKYTLQELKNFRYGDGQSILTLKETFSLTKGKIQLILDIKAKHIESLVLNLIRECEMENEIIIQSFRGKIIQGFHNLEPNLSYSLYRACIGKYFRPHKLFAKIFYNKLIKPYPAVYVSLDGPFMYDNFINLLKKNGKKVILGAMKLENYLDKIEQWNIDIVNADDPSKVKKFLDI
ncbi:MAG: glycerophosphodiester phosphodiesterase family protein [Promethearchaeota archaeon]|nr:MAG: glycerophosphodiester phosphodiesterase family protein [Candidatus Lokiarchaeota archaeon]